MCIIARVKVAIHQPYARYAFWTLGFVALFLMLTAASDVSAQSAGITEPTNVLGRYYCIAGDQPLANNYFQAGSVYISGQPFSLWCQALY